MSKDIIIQEGGVGRQLSVDRLKTALVGGGTCLWVPEDAVALGKKTITKDGTYKAADDDLYGYSQVTVRGIGKATGTGPDGETHSYTEDGEGGITDTVIPDSIAVVTPPTVTTYADGATIDFSGMVVKAYLKSGTVWTDAAHPNGVIPISELMLPVNEASKDEAHSDEWSDGQGLNATRLTFSLFWDRDSLIRVSRIIGTYDGKPAVFFQRASTFPDIPLLPGDVYATWYNGNLYAWGAPDRTFYFNGAYINEGEYYRYNGFMGSSFNAGYNGRVEYATRSTYYWVTDIAESTVVPTGNEDLQPVSPYQTIPVQWIRLGDYSTLESSFDITVT